MRKHERIDKKKALHWLEGDEKMFAKVKAIFVKNVPVQVAELKESIYADDFNLTERIAHTIMGSSAMLGASTMSEQAGNIERSAINGDMDSARLHFTSFTLEFEQVMAELAANGGE